MKKYVPSTLYIFVFIIINCCRKDHQNIQSKDYFPNEAGSYWQYSVYDSSIAREHPDYPRSYTVGVKILGTEKLIDGNDAKVWQYQYPWGAKNSFVRIIGDTIKIFDEVANTNLSYLDYPALMFLSPFHLDSSWDGKLFNVDNYLVAEYKDINAGNHLFTNSFRIYHYYQGPNAEYNDNYWFKPNVGNVRIYLNQSNLGNQTIQTWQLQTYSLK